MLISPSSEPRVRVVNLKASSNRAIRAVASGAGRVAKRLKLSFVGKLFSNVHRCVNDDFTKISSLSSQELL